MTEQGRMTSPTLNDMLRAAVSRTHPELHVEGSDKITMLAAVMHAYGWDAILRLGCQVEQLTWHPVVSALIATSDPLSLVDRWMRLERFGHSRNRIMQLECRHDGATTSITLRHVAIDGGSIRAENDLFIWGVLVGLLQAAGLTHVKATTDLEGAPPFVLFDAGQRLEQAFLPTRTDVVTLCGTAGNRAGNDPGRHSAPEREFSMTSRVSSLLIRDLLTPWALDAVAGALAVSPRSLQRGLHQEGTSFSEVVQRTRVHAAERLIREGRLALTEIAFCAGFSDQAHFSRLFRKYLDVPPSAYRDILPEASDSSRQGKSRSC